MKEERMLRDKPWRAIICFSLPLLAGGFFQQLYSMADAVIIGRLVGVKELAGVGATGAMSFLVIGFATGITSGFSVVIAQKAGMRNEKKVKSAVAASLILSLAATLVLTLLSTAAARPLLERMNTPKDIIQFSEQYIRILYLGLGATVYYNLTAGILRAIGDSKTPLYFLILASALNIILDLAAVLLLHGGVRGAAWATVLAQLFSAVVCHIYAVKKYPVLRLKREDWSAAAEEFRQEIYIGLPMALQFSITAVGILILQAYLNEFGSQAIAGFTAASKVENLVTQPFTALAVAMEVYCGQNYGAGSSSRLKEGIRSGLAIGLTAAVLASGINLLFGRQLIGLFLDTYHPDIVEYGYQYLVMIAVFFWALCGLQILRSALQGMGEVTIPTLGGVLELLARWGGCFLLAAPLGVAGIYFSTPLAWMLALALLIFRYRQVIK